MPILLQINSVVNYGSTGRIAEEIGLLAITNSWQSYIAFGRNEKQSKSELIKIGTDWDIKIHGIYTRLFDRHGLSSKKATLKLIEQINKIQPDIIHLHNLHGYYLNFEILFTYLSKANIPVVWSLHDCWAITGHCAHFAHIGCKKWESQCYKCPQTQSYPSSIFFDRSFKNYNLKKKLFTSLNNMTIVAVSAWLGTIAQKSYLAKYPIKIINNGVDLKVFEPQKNNKFVREKYSLGDKIILLGVATSWSEKKGINDYYKLSEILPDGYVIVLVGLNQEYIKKLPLKIIGLPRTESLNELAQLYSAADIVLNLSYEESFGLTTIEGFACGTPGIVYNCTASPELITSDTGIVVDKGNIEGLVNAIKKIQNNGKDYYTIACRERAKNFYNKDERYLDYIKLYESFLIKNNVNL